jgi:hypothetical protein
MQIAFTLYMIVLFPGGAPVVTNVGTWQKASDCGTAADGAFVRKNTQGGAGSFNLIRVRPQVQFRDAGDANSALSPHFIHPVFLARTTAPAAIWSFFPAPAAPVAIVPRGVCGRAAESN